MAAELPQLHVQRRITEGKGYVTYTLMAGLLDELLQQVGVHQPTDLPHDILRDFCRRSSHAEIVRTMEEAEKKQPGCVATVVVDEAGTAELHSSDVGFDTMMRFVPDANDEAELLCDPQYSSVEFDLRVFND